MRWSEPRQQISGTLDRCENVLVTPRLVLAGQQLAERAVLKGVTEGGLRLDQDLPAMGQEEEPRPRARRLRHADIVEGGDHRLPRAGRGHDQVASPTVDTSFRRKPIQ